MSKAIEFFAQAPENQKADASIIMLHGLGANGYQFENVAASLDFSSCGVVRYIMPHAPVRRVTLNHGMPANSWFDFTQVQDPDDEKGLNTDEFQDSLAAIHTFIQDEIKSGIRPERIFIFGYSQGGAVAYHTALTSTYRLGGVIAAASFLPIAHRVPVDSRSSGTPFLVLHGATDEVVPSYLAISAGEHLKSLGYPVLMKEYPALGHDLNAPKMWQDIEHFVGGELEKTYQGTPLGGSSFADMEISAQEDQDSADESDTPKID